MRNTFFKSKNPSKPDQLISDSTTSETLDTSIKKCTADNIDQIWKVAKIIRSELLQREKWRFTGSFDDFTLPLLLATWSGYWLVRIAAFSFILYYRNDSLVTHIPIDVFYSLLFFQNRKINIYKFYHSIEMSKYLLSKSLTLKLVFAISDFCFSIFV